MLDRTKGPLEEVPFQIRHPERIPAQRYYDPEFFELERQRLWPHVWQMACRLEEIPQVGDYVEYKILDKSVIVVNTKSGVKAFHNACRHRGVKLATGPGNAKTKGFICPFHGWRWNMDGDNTFVFSRKIFSEDNLQPAELNLVPCRVEVAAGCAFINFDNDAPALSEHLGKWGERMELLNVAEMKMEWWCGTVLPTNWKLAMEAFMEGYHVMRTHPQLQAKSASDTYGPDLGANPNLLRASNGKEFVQLFTEFCELLHQGMGGMISARELAVVQNLRDTLEVPEDMQSAAGVFITKIREQITARGRAEGLPVPDLIDIYKKDIKGVDFMFPHYFILPFFGAVSSYRIRPLTPETCFFEIWALAHHKDGEVQTPKEPTILPYDSKQFPEIPQQDYSNLPLQQEGLHAQGFEYMRLSNQIEGMISNYQRLIDGYLGGRSPEELVKGNRATNSGYEAPIIDIGF